MTDAPDTPLAHLMRERGIGQSKLANMIGSYRQQVDKLMTGRTAMSVEWARRLAPHFDMGWVEFLEPYLPKQPAPAVKGGVEVGDGFPYVGDPIQDLDEAALIGLWRTLSLLKKATIFDYLGFDHLPSLRDLTPPQDLDTLPGTAKAPKTV